MRSLLLALLAACLLCRLISGSSPVLLYDGKSTYSKVELSEHVTLQDITVSVWFQPRKKLSHGHLPQCIFAKGDWRGDTLRSANVECTVVCFINLLIYFSYFHTHGHFKADYTVSICDSYQ